MNRFICTLALALFMISNACSVESPSLQNKQKQFMQTNFRPEMIQEMNPLLSNESQHQMNSFGAINIIISAGLSKSSSSSDTGCNRDNNQGCELYNVSYHIATNQIHNIKQLTNSHGNASIFPSVSPDGKHIAYNFKEYLTTGAIKNSVRIVSIDGTNDRHMVNDARFPHYSSSSYFYFQNMLPAGKADTSLKTIERCSLYTSAGLPSLGACSTIFTSDTYSYSDPFRKPGNSSIVVQEETTSSVFQKDPSNPSAHINIDKPMAGIEKCGHPSFTPNGNILCSNNAGMRKDRKVYGFHYTPMRTIYEPYSKQSPSKKNGIVQPLFKHKTITELNKISSNYSTSACTVIGHTYVEACNSENLLLMTIHCFVDEVDNSGQEPIAQPDGRGETKFSRVFLVNISTPNDPKYTDITSAMESKLGKSIGDMESLSATCIPTSSTQ